MAHSRNFQLYSECQGAKPLSNLAAQTSNSDKTKKKKCKKRKKKTKKVETILLGGSLEKDTITAPHGISIIDLSFGNCLSCSDEDTQHEDENEQLSTATSAQGGLLSQINQPNEKSSISAHVRPWPKVQHHC